LLANIQKNYLNAYMHLIIIVLYKSLSQFVNYFVNIDILFVQINGKN